MKIISKQCNVSPDRAKLQIQVAGHAYCGWDNLHKEQRNACTHGTVFVI